VLCVKERGGLLKTVSSVDFIQTILQTSSFFRKSLKNNRLETIHNPGDFQESPEFGSHEKAEKTARRKKFSSLWISLASGVSLC
jgi:hypothetical protein